MTKLLTRPIHRSGLTGGVLENREPDLTDRNDANGTLTEAQNLWHLEGGRLGVVGGSKTQLTFAAHAISTVLGIWPFTPVGMVAICHDTTGDKTYAYALTDGGNWALPVGTESEAGSIVDIGWNTAGPHRPHAVELFERLYVVDATEGTREKMIVLSISAGALTLTTPAGYDLNVDSTPGSLKPYAAAVYKRTLFISGTDTEAVTTAAALVRHSFLGIEPGQATGFDYLAYNTIGAQGVWVRAMEPGNSVLLVAKENELYRISGSSRAAPGWQFAVQPVDNTLGFGCSNPYALCFANGYWYGVGAAGPWRSDGQSVESLLSPRLTSWANVDQLEVAQVVFDPDRRCVLFGFHLATEPTLPNYPFQFWAFQVDDGVWAPDRRFKSTRAFPMIRAIPQTAGAGPSTVPSGLTQSLTYGSMAYQEVTGYFTPGDLTARTEVWTRPFGGASVLYATLAASVARFSVTSFVPQQVKVRQVKAGVYTDFTAEVTMYPRLIPPTLSVGPRTLGGTMQADVTNLGELADLIFQAADGNPVYSALDVPGSATTSIPNLSNQACLAGPPADFAADWEAWAEDPDYPSPFDVSEPVHSYSYAGHCGGAADYPPRPSQVFWSSGGLSGEKMTTNAVTIQFRFCYPVIGFRVEYRLVGAGSYTVWSTVAYPGNYDLMVVTITGLAPSSRYEVRLNNVSVGRACLPTICYTKIAAPTLVATTNGSPGVPVVDLLISAVFANVRVYDQREVNTELLTTVGTSPSTFTRSWGSDGVPNVFYARAYNALWPAPYQFSLATSDGITDPATVGT